jgi:hypothetical protein
MGGRPSPGSQNKTKYILGLPMNKSTRLLITTAALAGLYTGALSTRTYAADKDAGKPEAKKDASTQHECKGHNSCKGTGGCGTSDNGCKGKNSCKGKGGCSTMAKSDKKKEVKPKA